MKTKSTFLLLTFLLSFIPVHSVQAEQEIAKSLSDSFALLYVSDAILLNDIVDDETSSNSKVSSLTLTGYLPDETTDLINQMINATKAQRNDHDQKCRETIEIYRQQGKTCEVDQTNAYCKSKRAELTSKIAALRKKRGGDMRKWFTKQWHGLKRAGAKFWHQIGPLGRKFLREVGPQALKIVAAGGPGTEALLRNLIKHTVKNMARQRAKQIGIQALQRILKIQIDVASAAGVDICEEDEEKTEGESEAQDQEKDISSDFNLPTSGVWDLTCQDTHDVDKYYQTVVWNVTIDWKARSFKGLIEAQGDQIYTTEGAYGAPDIVEITHLDWREEGSGSVTEDGFFWGDFTQITTSTITHQEVLVGDNSQESTENWIGAISETLDQVCFYRVGASDWFTLDWIRERGRQEMLDHPGGLCEALCYVK